KFIRGGVRYKAKTDLASGTQFSSLIINTNYEAADDVSSEIQTLTNNLDDEIETRVKVSAHNWLGGKFTSQTLNNIVFNALSDGTVTASGTASATASTIASSSWVLKAGTYILSSNPLPAGTGKYTYISLVKKSDISTFAAAERTESTLFTLSEDTEIFARVSCQGNGETFDVVFKPMIRLASDLYTEYTEYAMTNRELTDNVVVKDVTITPETGVTIDYNGTHKIGNLVILNFRFILDASFSVAEDAPIATIDIPPLDNVILTSVNAAWDGAVGGIISILKATNIIKLAAVGNFVAGKSYVVNVAYVCA
ncbi:MAG: hypothetical protein IKE94_05025, partial [Aeriscardovia sp.]|nr:hypothetical protein [Aeriscardovia sp.]